MERGREGAAVNNWKQFLIVWKRGRGEWGVGVGGGRREGGEGGGEEGGGGRTDPGLCGIASVFGSTFLSLLP